MLLVKIAKKSHQMKGFITELGVVSLGTHAYPRHFHLIHDMIIKWVSIKNIIMDQFTKPYTAVV